ncbi:MAG: hypothetical protein HY719_04060, partial [Planctomycetes bacterium]|nr:hypothetical protein [Planctomycetota bacterium]
AAAAASEEGGPPELPVRGEMPEQRDAGHGRGRGRREVEGGVAGAARRAMVSYWRVMNPQETFPVTVFLFDPTAPPAADGAGDVALAKGERDHPVAPGSVRFTVRLTMPGCLVTPDREEVDASPARSRAIFHVTPVAGGRVEGSARIYRGEPEELVESIPLLCVARPKTLARVATLLGIAGPLFHVAATLLRADAGGVGAALGEMLRDFFASPISFPTLFFAAALLLAAAAYRIARPAGATAAGSSLSTSAHPPT